MSLAALAEIESTAGWGQLTILAIVQGLAEFLPISSSGHLVLAQELLDVHEPSIALEVALHVGTLVAVLLVYWRDVVGILKDALKGEVREVGLLIVGSIPAGIVGVFLDDVIEGLFGDVRWVAGGLFLTSALLFAGWFLAKRQRARPGTVQPSFGAALLVGVFQAVAICPGVSRSGSTIVAGLAVGWSPARAARFSFLLSIIAIGGAAALNLPDAFETSGEAARLGFGAAIAAVVGVLALRWLLRLLERGAFRAFAVYCATVGAIVAWLTWQ